MKHNEDLTNNSNIFYEIISGMNGKDWVTGSSLQLYHKPNN